MHLDSLGQLGWRNVFPEALLSGPTASLVTRSPLRFLPFRMVRKTRGRKLTFIKQCASAWSCTGLAFPGVQTSISKLNTPGTWAMRLRVYFCDGSWSAKLDQCEGIDVYARSNSFRWQRSGFDAVFRLCVIELIRVSNDVVLGDWYFVVEEAVCWGGIFGWKSGEIVGIDVNKSDKSKDPYLLGKTGLKS